MPLLNAQNDAELRVQAMTTYFEYNTTSCVEHGKLATAIYARRGGSTLYG
ncbi:hypothetical protein [Nitrobacter vulgaris]|nr:hypothetical protein [Nitrobacter vulgaris]